MSDRTDEGPGDGAVDDDQEPIDELLVRRGLLVERPGSDELRLADGFEQDLGMALGDRADAEGQLLALVGLESKLTFRDGTGAGDGSGTDTADQPDQDDGRDARPVTAESAAGETITWPSVAALRFDGAAATALGPRTWFSALDTPDRVTVLESLRLFLESCPNCDAELAFESDHPGRVLDGPVTALCCPDCDAVLYEVDADLAAAAER